MTDGGCAASSRPLERDTDLARGPHEVPLRGDSLTDAFAAGEAAQKVRHADYLDAYAGKLGERYDPDTAGTLKPIIAGLAATIRAGLADSDGDPQ